MIRFMEEVAIEAGRLLLSHFRSLDRSKVVYKGEKDMVTTADREAQDFLIAKIQERFPDDRIMAEEEGGEIQGGEGEWFIDPLDGTTNFLHGFPFFSVSIARSWRGEVEAGVVHAPVLGETFTAVRGEGAFCNGERIRVSTIDNPIRSLVSTGFACVRSNCIQDGVPIFDRIVHEVEGVRRPGSAAIDLAFTAAGRFDGFWEMNLNSWDVSAGILLVREAGGVITDFIGGSQIVDRKEIVAGNPSIHAYILDRIGKTATSEGWNL